MLKPLAIRKSMRAGLFIALAIFAWSPLSAIAQRPTRQPAGAAPAGAAVSSPISTEGELKATVFNFRDGNLVVRYKYYWWRDGRYLSYSPANFAPVPPAACA